MLPPVAPELSEVLCALSLLFSFLDLLSSGTVNQYYFSNHCHDCRISSTLLVFTRNTQSRISPTLRVQCRTRQALAWICLQLRPTSSLHWVACFRCCPVRFVRRRWRLQLNRRVLRPNTHRALVRHTLIRNQLRPPTPKRVLVDCFRRFVRRRWRLQLNRRVLRPNTSIQALFLVPASTMVHHIQMLHEW
jgi:hypothetical protein